uniref:Uncharacterized protein n=1 Tax=Picea glauca TaxID=3330 RepID=A0A124GMP9_PICGL|nr:hypothetical protein ABT39_MTgene1864 [Picea glauca]
MQALPTMEPIYRIFRESWKNTLMFLKKTLMVDRQNVIMIMSSS